MPVNTAMPVFLTSCEEKYTYGNMANSEMLCVRVANKIKKVNHFKSDVIRQPTMLSELSRFLF